VTARVGARPPNSALNRTPTAPSSSCALLFACGRRRLALSRWAIEAIVQGNIIGVLALLAIAIMTLACAPATGPSSASPVQVPTVVSRVDAEYPLALRAAGIHGSVVVTGTVPKEGGTLRNARVVRSDHPQLEPLALDAVSRWIWRPGTLRGEPVDAEFTTTVTFSLDQ
jgi:protein TonB